MARRKKTVVESEKPSQEWLVTFGDLLTLLITFFVLLISMSSMDSQQLRKTFGFFTGAFAALEKGEGSVEDQELNVPDQRQMSRETLGTSPGLITSSMINSQVLRITKRAEELKNKIVDVAGSRGRGLHPLDNRVLDLLQQASPVKVVRHKDSLEMDLHVGLLFESHSPQIRKGSAELMSEVRAMLQSEMRLRRVQTSPLEKGLESRYFSPWQLAAWRSAAVIRWLRPTPVPPATVVPGQDGKYLKLIFAYAKPGS
jgi:chemotaxis protein MotB